MNLEHERLVFGGACSVCDRQEIRLGAIGTGDRRTCYACLLRTPAWRAVPVRDLAEKIARDLGQEVLGAVLEDLIEAERSALDRYIRGLRSDREHRDRLIEKLSGGPVDLPFCEDDDL